MKKKTIALFFSILTAVTLSSCGTVAEPQAMNVKTEKGVAAASTELSSSLSPDEADEDIEPISIVEDSIVIENPDQEIDDFIFEFNTPATGNMEEYTFTLNEKDVVLGIDTIEAIEAAGYDAVWNEEDSVYEWNVDGVACGNAHTYGDTTDAALHDVCIYNLTMVSPDSLSFKGVNLLDSYESVLEQMGEASFKTDLDNTIPVNRREWDYTDSGLTLIYTSKELDTVTFDSSFLALDLDLGN